MKRLAALMLSAVFLAGCGRAESAEDWIERLSQNDPAEKSKAALALGRLGPDAKLAVAPLVELLRDGDVQGRWSAATALGHIGAEAVEAIPALQQALKDQDGDVRDAAAEAIERIKRRSQR